MIRMARIGLESCNLPLTRFLDQALSPEMGMANSVDKALACSDYQEPDCSDEQEPETRTIGNPNRPQTRRIAAPQRPLTLLTNNPSRIVANVELPARGSSALWVAPSPRASFLGRCKQPNSLLGIER